uniref:Uncharacterized protein n=1 Tax=Tanacetum cinerariifolium TaxID=118510 RepID=A0A6L2M9G3_TANCI|nr:hypothetical protein [Tanacetum cinerariifolium]
MSTQQDIYAAGSKNCPPMLNKDNYDPWSSCLLRNPDCEVLVAETFHERTDEELTETKVKQIEADDQAIQTILMGLPKDIYVVVDVVKLLRKSGYVFTSTDGESIESYYHRFSKLMNEFKRNKHFSEKIASNLKFLNNLQPEWRRHVTIVHQTKDLHTADYTQLYDFLKYNQVEVNELRADYSRLHSVATGDLDEIDEVNANCMLMANLQQASTSGLRLTKLPSMTQMDQLSVSISHQSSSVRTPQQIGVVKRRNRTLVEAARTMLIFSCALLFLCAEAIATACYTQNRSIIHRRFDKTLYELINGRNRISPFFMYLGLSVIFKMTVRILEAWCERTKKIMETMNVTFDELSTMTFKQHSSKPRLQSMTSGQITMYDDYIGGQPSVALKTPTTTSAPQVLQTSTTSTTTADTAPTPTNSSSQAANIPTLHRIDVFENPFVPPSTSAAESSSSQYVDPSNMHTPDIVHATYLCARYQAKPTEKHLKEVKRIFRYLRGTVNMGVWREAGELVLEKIRLPSSDRFNYLVRRLGMRCLSPHELERLAKSQ